MNKKIILTGAMTMSMALSGFGQKCVKFIDYQNKTINTKGINMQVFGQTMGAGETTIAPLYRAADAKLQQLDLLQYNICEQLKNIKTDFMREKLQSQYTNLLMKMMKLQESAGTNTAGSTQQSTVAIEVSDKNTEEDLTPTPAPAPSPMPVPTPAPVKEEPKDEWVDENFPCFGSDYYDTDNLIRASAMETDDDPQVAQTVALEAAVEVLASKIEISVKTVTENYLMRNQKIGSVEKEKRIQRLAQSKVNVAMSGWKEICHKVQRNSKEKTYRYFCALEISLDRVLQGTFGSLKQNADVKDSLPSYNEFKETFKEVMNEYDASEKMPEIE